MSTAFSHFPTQPQGIVTISGDAPNEFIVAGQPLVRAVTIVSTTIDNHGSHTPTTRLRAGLALGEITATGKYGNYLISATDGRAKPKAILMEPVNMFDVNDVVEDKTAIVMIPQPGIIINQARLFPATDVDLMHALRLSGVLFNEFPHATFPFADDSFIHANVELDFDGSGATPVELIPRGLNTTGLALVMVKGMVTEVFAGSSQDQGIARLETDEGTPVDLNVDLSNADAAADVVGDAILNSGSSESMLDATVGQLIARVGTGLGVNAAVIQETAGTPAGKMRIFTTWAREG